ncbi:unnamed protein product [Urochloa humidicola]
MLSGLGLQDVFEIFGHRRPRDPSNGGGTRQPEHFQCGGTREVGTAARQPTARRRRLRPGAKKAAYISVQLGRQLF